MPTPTDTSRPRLEPCFFGPVQRYVDMARAGLTPDEAVDTLARYDKRHKAVHRTLIADTRGPLTLTVPVARPSGADLGRPLRWADVIVSPHDRWWEIHWTTLESAYGRTPFFEFYAARFRPFFSEEAVGRSIVDLDMAAERLVSEILLLDDRLHPATGTGNALPYWQVRADRLGFIPGLGVLDLIFNLGPMAALYVRR